MVFLAVSTSWIGCVRFHDMHPEEDSGPAASEEQVEYDTVSLMPPEGGSWLSRTNNDYGIQGSWFYHTDLEDSLFDGDVPIPTRVEETVVIKAGGTVVKDYQDTNQWGLGFGVSLCHTDGDDLDISEPTWAEVEKNPRFFNSDPEENKRIFEIWDERREDAEAWAPWHPFVRYYNYPLRWCPFNPDLYRQFRGIAFDLKGTFGKLEIEFKQGNQTSWANQPRCYVFDSTYGFEPQYFENVCPNAVETGDREWRIEVLFDDVISQENKKMVGLIRTVEFGVKTYPNGVDERPFEFTISNMRLLLEKDGDPPPGSNEDYASVFEETKAEPLPSSPSCAPDTPDGCPDELVWITVDGAFQMMEKEATVAQVFEYLVGLDINTMLGSLPDWSTCNLNQYLNLFFPEHERNEEEAARVELLKRQSANCVDYTLATGFCEWLGGRVPTVGEWELAARSGSTTRENRYFEYPFGQVKYLSNVGCDQALTIENCPDSGSGPYVGCAENGKTDQGICDMAGNLAEWTSDSFSGTDFKIIKGGSLYMSNDNLTIDACSMEHVGKPDNYMRLGVRCVRDVPAAATKE